MSDAIDPSKLKVAELRAELQARGLDTKGNKPVLVERLKEALQQANEDDSGEEPVEGEPDQDLERDGDEDNDEGEEELDQEDEVLDQENEAEPVLDLEPEQDFEQESEHDNDEPALELEPEGDLDAEEFEQDAEPQQEEEEDGDTAQASPSPQDQEEEKEEKHQRKESSPPQQEEEEEEESRDKDMGNSTNLREEEDEEEEEEEERHRHRHGGDAVTVKEELEDEYYKSGYEEAPMEDDAADMIKKEVDNGFKDEKIDMVEVKEEPVETKQEPSSPDTEERRGEKRRAHSRSRSPDSKKARPEVEEVRVEDEPEFDKSAVLLDWCVASLATTTAESSIPPEEEEEQQHQPAPKKKGKGKKTDSAPKQGWSLPDQTEQELVEWLQANTYLWLRSTKYYHRKKAAWEMKAKELGVSLKHLQNWWKNVKDWYVKLSKRTSGQATKLLTERDKWLLKNIAFYKSSMPTDVPNTLVSLPRAPSSTDSASSAASPAAAPTSQAQESHDFGDANISEDMEVAAVAQASTSCHKRRTAGYESQEEGWMLDLRSTMKANQALLERLLQERPQPQTRREAFIRYVSDTLRTVPDEEYQVLQDIIADTLRQRHMGPSTSGAGLGPSTAPQVSTSTSQQSTFTPLTYSQPQYYQLPGFASPSPSKCQYGVGGGQQSQSLQPLQPLTTPVRARDSAESVGRILASSIMED